MRIATVLAAGAVLLVAAVPASAHTALVGSRPADGAVLRQAPARVVLTFSQALGAAGTLEVRGPAGTATVRAALDPADARRMTGRLAGGGAGAHVVAWTATAADGHPLAGEIRFRVRPPDVAPAVRRVALRVTAAAAALRRAARAAA